MPSSRRDNHVRTNDLQRHENPDGTSRARKQAVFRSLTVAARWDSVRNASSYSRALPKRFVALAVALGLVGVLAGCPTPAGELFPPVEPPLVWPGPPRPARVQYVGQLRGEADLKPPRSGWDNFWGVVLGTEPPAEMQSPLDVALIGSDRLFVADPAAGCVHAFDLERRTYRRIGEGLGLKAPVSVATDDQRLYVVDSEQGGVLYVDLPDGSPGWIGRGDLKRPAGICVIPADRSIVVADAGGHELVRFARDGAVLDRFGTRGQQRGQFNYPTHVDCDRHGRLLVSDTLNFRVQVLDLEGRVLTMFGSPGPYPGNLSLPKGVASDSDGHLYVVDARFENVQIFDRQGQILLPFGSEGTEPGQFWLPAGIHIDRSDRIWVCDSYNHRIQLFRYLKTPQSQPTDE